MRHVALALACLPLVPACQSTAEGAAQGAFFGAAGSALVAAVFGGDVGDAAARGAVGGATVGALSGAARGAAQQEQEKMLETSEHNRQLELRNRELELERELLAKIGPDNTEALRSLLRCQYDLALTQARRASDSENDDFRLASTWLEAMVAVDARRVNDARAVYPRLVTEDPEVVDEADAELRTLGLVDKVEQTREDFGRPRNCR